MNLSSIHSLINNFHEVSADGNYNVDVNVLHDTVVMAVGYPSPGGSSDIDFQYFYPREPHGSFPDPIALKAGDRISFFTLLVPQFLNSGNDRLINFGVGAEEVVAGFPDEVVQVKLSQVASTGNTPSPIGQLPDFHRNIQSYVVGCNLNQLPAADSGKAWQIEINSNAQGKIQQLMSYVFLAHIDGHYYEHWTPDHDHSVQISENMRRSGNFYLCTLVSGTSTNDSERHLDFEVGDPEKDARVRVLAV
ncbi:MAG: hypothetical protein AAF741_18155 [Bacteroidota bacterium]